MAYLTQNLNKTNWKKIAKACPLLDTALFRMADNYIQGYSGGNWKMHEKDGVMIPVLGCEENLVVQDHNSQRNIELPSEYASVALWMIALSSYSFKGGRSGEAAAELYYKVRDFFFNKLEALGDYLDQASGDAREALEKEKDHFLAVMSIID